jgi:tRNA uridine 5-carboxymethylaminomethyl modification enzyme
MPWVVIRNCFRQNCYSVQDVEQTKGPAMWSPRVQSDRMRFAEEWRMMLKEPNLDFYQEMVSGLIIENSVVGVRTSLGVEIRSKSVVLTNGTF